VERLSARISRRGWSTSGSGMAGAPDAPLPVRYGRWGDEQWAWLDRYGYDVFDLNDATVQWKRDKSS